MFEEKISMKLYEIQQSIGRLNYNLQFNNGINTERNDLVGDIGVNGEDLIYALELLDGESREVIDIYTNARGLKKQLELLMAQLEVKHLGGELHELE
ncbi:hypothetical protein [Jeotgalibaca porci]|uniref:hypothetical protein n=1 Tax=Jeotgalibaca porci TaxID=1868793 RepID=UPI0035A027E0